MITSEFLSGIGNWGISQYIPVEVISIARSGNIYWVCNSRSTLDGHFNPLVFWYQWDSHEAQAFTGRVLLLCSRVCYQLGHGF